MQPREGNWCGKVRFWRTMRNYCECAATPREEAGGDVTPTSVFQEQSSGSRYAWNRT
jgi:hypothetical protein